MKKQIVIAALLLIVFVSSCSWSTRSQPYTHQKCLDVIPKDVKGLKIIAGPRTRQSLIRDMVPVVCYSRVWRGKMIAQGEDFPSGRIVFRVTIEYTGEVTLVEAVETTLGSDKLVRHVSDLIMDTDFVGWARCDTDTIFLYPISF